MYLCTKKMFCIFLIFILIMGNIYTNILNDRYDSKYESLCEEVKIVGVLITEPEEKEYKYSYTIRIESINGDEKYKNTKLIFNLKKSKELKEIPRFGDEIELTATIEKPSTARNYKGFDYKTYLKSKGIYGTVEAKDVDVLAHEKIDVVSNVINSIQNNLKNNLTSILDKDESALCIGILIGDRTGITDEIEDNFKKSNLTHMLAVSGSHITYIITALAAVLGGTNKKFSKIFTIIFLVFFMALTGFTASVNRASIMGILVLLASLIHRKPDTINNLGIASFLILLQNPYIITDAGFLLSFAGTIGIVLLNKPINELCLKLFGKIANRKIVKGIINSFSITLSANIIIIPIMAYTFSTVSLTFWISNILAGPVMEIATIFGFVVYFVSIIFNPLAKFLGIFLNVLMMILLKIAEISSLIPGSSMYIKTPYLLECVIYYLIIFLILNYKKIKANIKDKLRNDFSVDASNDEINKFSVDAANDEINKLSVDTSNDEINKLSVNTSSDAINNSGSLTNLLIACLKKNYKLVSVIVIVVFSLTTLNHFIPRNLKIYFVDVGQGDCTLIQIPTNKTILIDGGGSEFGTFDVGESTLLPYLLDRRILSIDYIMASHMDSDHIKRIIYDNGKFGS